jgi:glycosyltransferase involved in cell wall biosynthesis
MSEIIDDGQTGLLFEPGSAADLAEKVTQVLGSRSPEKMRSAARLEFEAHYTAEANYEQLMNIYHRAIGQVSPQPLALAN